MPDPRLTRRVVLYRDRCRDDVAGPAVVRRGCAGCGSVYSGGRRNDGSVGVQYEPLHGFGGGDEAEGLAGSRIQLVGDLEEPLR
jgi:hypothetical protein